MTTRRNVLKKASDECLQELYSLAQPSVKWEDFLEECKVYSKKYKEWEEYRRALKDNNLEIINHPAYVDWKDKSINECIGPKPYEFYYLPKDVMKEVCDSYVYAYKIDSHQNLLDIIKILIDYCKEPIVDKYIDDYTDEYGNHHPGYKSYDHPDNLQKEITKIINNYSIEDSSNSDEVMDICNKFFEFLDMAGKFYNWNSDLNSFLMTVYLGPSPNSDKETVIKNWKTYRNKDITINDSIYEEYDD